MKFEITRKGEYPVLKYTFRGEHGHFAVVVLDDESGDIFINPGNQIALQHWWGESGRATKTLREFLIKTNTGYLEDKFSYGLSRWSGEEAKKNLFADLEEGFGHPDSWPSSVTDLWESLEGADSFSSDYFYTKIMECEELAGRYDEMPSGELNGHPEVTHFLKSKWPHFVEFWKNELLG